MDRTLNVTTRPDLLLNEIERLSMVEARAKEVCDTFKFKFTNVLDDNGHCIPHRNATQLKQLQRALEGD